MKKFNSELFNSKEINDLTEVRGGLGDKVCTSELTSQGGTLKSDSDQRWDSGNGACDYNHNTDTGTDCPPLAYAPASTFTISSYY